MTNTPNHNYNTPVEGTTDWHIPLNENFEQLDVDVTIRGPEDDRVNYDPEVGSKYEATDSGAVFYGNGDSWVLADRRVNNLESETISTKQIQKDGPKIVSPSASTGYDSLQSAIDDAAAGGSNEIWLAENVAENIHIPHNGNASWGLGNGLTIRGITGSHTEIKDNKKDGTPIIDLDASGRISNLTLHNLAVVPDGVDTRAFNFNVYEQGGGGVTSGGSSDYMTILNCRFEAPVINSRPFFLYVENTAFRANVKADWSIKGTTYDISSGYASRRGNQMVFNRCNFISNTEETKRGAFWGYGINCVLFDQPHFNVVKAHEDNYDTSAGNVGCVYISGGGEIQMNSPYVEKVPDYGLVFGSEATPPKGIIITNDRFHSIKLVSNVQGLVIDSPGSSLTVDCHGAPKEGSKIIETSNLSGEVTLEGNNAKFFHVHHAVEQGFDVLTPPIPGGTGKEERKTNNSNSPVIVFQSGATGTRVQDRKGNDVLLPADINTIWLGVRNSIYYETEVPDEWMWFGVQ